MNDYLKIKKDLKSINKNYKNLSKLKNKQELPDSMFHFWKSYSQENNELIELLFSKICNKLNLKFEKYMDKIEKQLLNINLDD